MPFLNVTRRADLQTSRVLRRKKRAICLLVIIIGLVTAASEEVTGASEKVTGASKCLAVFLEDKSERASCQEPISTAADQKSELDEAERLTQKAKDLSLIYEYRQAILLVERALAIREKALGPNHPLVANSLNSLADFYRSDGSDERAEPLYQRALAIREKALGPDHPDVAASLNGLAKLYRGRQDYVQAEPLFHRAIAIAEKGLGVRHPTVALYLNNLAL
ncbi:MAG TPA: tetratricopeptide repeat-containing protein, partial [Pyrinomonadaceae bacterium]|nr:tetratricopeptide repeat-containing protein [Pyrinomonadaceae bacterium]